uniref:Peptidase C19 ubiquitin carboxyl-terminal hydrolase domain-containing protein n=1 Tax=Strongyloides venezuelensis TaxID=75913 RepID=A0A0K0FG05_STRVS
MPRYVFSNIALSSCGIFVKKVVADEFRNYRHEDIQEISQEKEAHIGNSDIRYGKTFSLDLLKQKSRGNRRSEKLLTPKRSNLDRRFKKMKSTGTQCFASSVMQLVFLCNDFLENATIVKKTMQ